MNNSNLIDLLRRFDTHQKKRFLDFIDSPYFNSHAKTAELGHYLLDEIPSFTSKNLQKERIFQAMFPEKTYDDRFFSNLMSRLLKLAYRFLGEERREKVSTHLYHHQMMALLEMDAPTHARRIEKRYNRQLEALPFQSFQSCLEWMNYFEALDQTYVLEASRGFDKSLEEKNRTLDQYFLAYKLRIACDMISRNQIINTVYSPTFFSFCLKEIKKTLNEEKKTSAYFIYYFAYLMLEKPEEEKYYSNFLEFLYEKRDDFPKEELWVLYNYALNHCIRKINSGYGRFYAELHQLYRQMLEGGVLLKKGYLTQWDFKNIVTVGLRIKDFKWTEAFIREYQSALHPNEQKNALIYNLASLYLSRQDYEQALRQLHQVDFTDPAYHLGAKIIQIKSYYELGEEEALMSLIEAFRKYVHRNRSLGSYKKLANLNFLQLTKGLYELKEKEKRLRKEAYQKERERFIKKLTAMDPVANKAWLLEKSKG
jgi:hypothetical protein